MTSYVPTPRRIQLAGPSPRSELALSVRQLDALHAWHERRRVQEAAAASGQRSREQRLDLARRMDVLREQHRAIVARTDEQLRDSARLLDRPERPRAVVVHRSAWFTDKLVQGLRSASVEVVARLTNGAEAVGLVVAEQPDLLLVEETLPMLSGSSVVREIVELSPETVIGAQVAHDDGIAEMLDAGARAAYARRVPPAEVAAGLVGLLDRPR